jgi:F0F1-type ATP synthase membrane subunit b/b'
MGIMKFAGKAFIRGMFGSLGVAVAILGTAAVVSKVAEKTIRNAIRKYETEIREAFEKAQKEEM